MVSVVWGLLSFAEVFVPDDNVDFRSNFILIPLKLALIKDRSMLFKKTWTFLWDNLLTLKIWAEFAGVLIPTYSITFTRLSFNKSAELMRSILSSQTTDLKMACIFSLNFKALGFPVDDIGWRYLNVHSCMSRKISSVQRTEVKIRSKYSQNQLIFSMQHMWNTVSSVLLTSHRIASLSRAEE